MKYLKKVAVLALALMMSLSAFTVIAQEVQENPLETEKTEVAEQKKDFKFKKRNFKRPEMKKVELTEEEKAAKLEEFKKKFAKEIDDSLESYKRTVLAKPTFRVNNDIEGDYFFSLRYNFNNHGISNWYIEKM